MIAKIKVVFIFAIVSFISCQQTTTPYGSSGQVYNSGSSTNMPSYETSGQVVYNSGSSTNMPNFGTSGQIVYNSGSSTNMPNFGSSGSSNPYFTSSVLNTLASSPSSWTVLKSYYMKTEFTTSSNLRCSLYYYNPSDLSSSCVWFVSGQSTPVYTGVTQFDNSNGVVYSDLPTTEWPKYLNKNVYCQIDTIPLYALRIQSEDFFLGLVVDVGGVASTSNTIQLEEGSLAAQTLGVTPTFPLLCSSTTNCEISVSLDIDDDSLVYLSSDSSCSTKITNDKSLKAKWSLVSAVNVENKYRNNIFIDLSFSISVGSGVSSSYFRALTLPAHKIKYVPMIRSYQSAGGSCYNDPHCYTNDGIPFEFQYKDGEYLMYENSELQFRVHMISEPCALWPGCGCNYCIRNIFVQSLDDFVSFDAKTEPQLVYVNLRSENKGRMPLIWKDDEAKLPKNTAFKVTRSAYYYKITSHFGTAVLISKWGSLQMIPSKLDKNKVMGLLGNYNGNWADDFTQTKIGTVNNMDAFFDAYNVEKQKWPLFSKGQYYPVTSMPTVNSEYCRCQKVSNGNYKKNCNNGPVKGKLYENDRKKRQTTSSTVATINATDLSYILDLKLTIEEEKVKSAQSTCASVLGSHAMLIVCSNQQIINLTKIIEDCENDFRTSQMNMWTEHHFNANKGWCKQVNLDDSTFHVSTTINGVTTLIENPIIDNFCLHDCSGQGTCTKGVCVCNTNYGGEDCSVNVNTPPKLSKTLFTNNICDIRQNNCQSVALYATGLSSNPKVVYTLTNAQTSAKKRRSTSASSTIDTYGVTEKIIVANLPQETVYTYKSLSVKLYSISVTNKDATTASIPIEYGIYDSICHSYSSGVYSLKADTCDIEGACYKDGEKNTKDAKQSCNSKNSLYSWTNLSIKLSANNAIIFAFILFASIF